MAVCTGADICELHVKRGQCTNNHWATFQEIGSGAQIAIMTALKWEEREKPYGKEGKTIKSKYLVGKFVRIEDIPDDVETFVEGNKQDTTSSDYSCYKVIEKGEEELNKVHKEHAHFPISHLVHDTNGEAAVGILENEKITPGDKKEFKEVGSYHFSWWGLALDENETQSYETAMKTAIKVATNRLNDRDIELLNSHPFSRKLNRRYGPWRFSVKVNELLKCYENSLKEIYEDCKEKIYQERILCTEVYRCEVMHTILVHPTIMKEHFQHLDTLDQYITECMEKEVTPVVKKRKEAINIFGIRNQLQRIFLKLETMTENSKDGTI